MPRLRVTTVLSVLALIVGVGGTAWLSTQTTGWVVTPRTPPSGQLHHPMRRYPATASAAASMHRRRAPSPPSIVDAQSAPAVAPVAAATTPPPLLPLAMPGLDGGPSYARLRGHLAGRVLLHLRIDGDGQVIDATVAQSSGDGTLDAYATSVVRGWHFAVPDDRPDGISGDLPLHFEPDGQGVADDR